MDIYESNFLILNLLYNINNITKSIIILYIFNVLIFNIYEI